LTAADLATVYGQAANRALQLAPTSVIAVVDRDGRAVLIRTTSGGTNYTPAQAAIAVSKAGTTVFLSSDGEAFTSRTAGFIIQQHFPPGVLNTPTGPLVGVGFSSLAYSDVNYFHQLDGTRIPGTRLYGSPGGVPLYKNGQLVGGIGVTGPEAEVEDGSIYGPDVNEQIALSGQIGFEPPALILATNIFIAGIRLPYVASDATPAPAPPGGSPGTGGVVPPSPVVYPIVTLNGVQGQLRTPIQGDPATGTISGQARLSAAEVQQILGYAAARAVITRAGIRQPAGSSAAVFITVVSNPNQAGLPPVVLGTFNTPDATVFSWDVAIQKGRTALFFSNNARAFSTRTVGFLAETMFPPGIENEPAGPFNGMQERFSGPIITGGAGTDPNLPNGITIFAGGFPLYRNGVMIGAIGVSGDGIEEDDLISASGTVGFQPDPSIRADNFTYLGVRLPYAKFPREPNVNP